jgi:hypothetical protein
MRSCQVKITKDQPTQLATITDEEKRRSEKTRTKSSEIRQRQTFTYPLATLDVSSEHRLDMENFISSSESRRRDPPILHGPKAT